MTRKALALGALLALLAGGTAQASDTYRITAGGNQDWGPDTGGFDQTASTPFDVSGTMTDDGPAVGTVDYQLQAGPGIARVSMDGQVTVPSNLAYPFNPALQAVSTTELTVSGPAFEINTSLNLHVDGFLDTTVCGGNTSCGALSVFIFAPAGTTAGTGSEFNTLGDTRENDLGLHFDPVEGGYHVYGDVTSREFGLRTGTPIPIGIVLNLSGRFGGNPALSTFGGSFDDPARRLQVSFAPSGPVLNLPEGYTVTGSGVVDNRWYDPFPAELDVDDCDDPAAGLVVSIRGDLVLHALEDCDGIAFPHLTHIGGDLVVEDNDGGGDIDLDDASVDGAIDVSGNEGDLSIGIGSVAGTVDISGTGGDLDVGIGSAAGTVDLSGTGGDLDVGIGSAAGTVDISGTGGDLDIDPGTVDGDLDISENPDAGVVDVGAGQIGGDLVITDDGTAVVDASDSLTVSGDVDVESGGGGMLDLSGVEAGGDETVAADGADGVTAETAGGTTDVSVLGGTAAMHVVLPVGAFDEPVAFTITRRADEPAQGGTASDGAAAVVDPLGGYALAFAVPVLDADAELAFTIDLAALDADSRAALLAGIASGSATLVSKADEPGSVYGAFARCAEDQAPEAGGCVAVTLLAADGSEAPSGAEPAFARFDGIAGHFSTYAVALVSEPPSTPPPASEPQAGPQSPPPAAIPSRPTAAQIRALLRTEIAPHGKASRIRALLKRRYRLRFEALTAGTAEVGWYRLRKGRKPLLIAKGRHTFAAAGRVTVRIKLTRAGRRQLRHAKRLHLTAKGTFTPALAAPVTATRRFTLRR
ncbi:MAG TPA: hypothetical protein VFG79_18000 [Solirubrobacter sp.]|nr:hypothetical protein [Solirubrobacter sp.]